MAALKRFGWCTTKLVAFTGLAIVGGASVGGLTNASRVRDRVRKELLEERWQSSTAAQKEQECFQAFLRALNGYYSIVGSRYGTIRDASVSDAERCRRLAVREVYESEGADHLHSRCSFVEPDERASGAFEAFRQQERAKLGVLHTYFLFDEMWEAQGYSRYQTGRRTEDEERGKRQGKAELEQLVADRSTATPSYQAELQGSLGRTPAQVNDLSLRRLKPQSKGALLMKQILDSVPESEQQGLCWADLMTSIHQDRRRCEDSQNVKIASKLFESVLDTLRRLYGTGGVCERVANDPRVVQVVQEAEEQRPSKSTSR